MDIKSLVNAAHNVKSLIPFETIETEKDYNFAIQMMDEITDHYDESLSVIIDILAPKISEYEDSLEELAEFNERIANLAPSSAMLKLLMEHHNL